MSGDLLAVYLTDHLAGATAGSSRMRRLAEHERSASDGAELDQVAAEIEEDRQTLDQILTAAGVSPPWHKTVSAWLAERVGLLKANGRLVRRSPLTSVLELELMRMAVTGKASLWEALKHTDLRNQFDFDGLLERATGQLRRLEAAHDLRASIVGQRADRDR